MRPFVLASLLCLAPLPETLAQTGPPDAWDCRAPGVDQGKGQEGGAGANPAAVSPRDCRAVEPPRADVAETAAVALTATPTGSSGDAVSTEVAEVSAPAPPADSPEPDPSGGAQVGAAQAPSGIQASTPAGTQADPLPTASGPPSAATPAIPKPPQVKGDSIPDAVRASPGGAAAWADPIPVRPPDAPIAADVPPLPASPPPLPLEAERIPVPAVVDLLRQDLAGVSPWAAPLGRPATPAAATPAYRGEDARLYQGLPWDYCGPRVGRVGLGGFSTPAADPNRPIDAVADRADYDRTSDLVRLQGGVEIRQGDQRLEADQTRYHRASDDLDATGHVYLEYPGARLLADSARYNLSSKQGTLEGVRYRLAGNANLRGSAAQAELLPGEVTHYQDVIYTTCAPGRSDWSIRASDLTLDHADGMGTAWHARLRLGDVPVLYSPYLRFPIDDRRRSGFLIPSIGTSNDTGLDLTIPYYWNIAPNMDATFSPRIMSSRGLMLGGQFRHLLSFQKLEIDGEILPNDEDYEDGGSRGALRVQQTGTLGPRWSTSIDYNQVSDDQYLEDFGRRLSQTSTRNLIQRGELRRVGDGYSVVARVQDFQTIDPSITPASYPYAQLPHLELNLTPVRQGPVEFDFEANYDYFYHATKVDGDRLLLLPSLRLPLRRSYGHLIPRARIYSTNYHLNDTAKGVDPEPLFLIPSLDLDAKLIFDRETDWFGHGALQTLEPRIYYVRTPYEDQADTPLFDTTLLDFSFASLFRPNRFTGYDRIGDENRLTVGLTSRTLGEGTGREWLRASLGQVFYFDPRQVQLSGTRLDEESTSAVAGELSSNPTAGLTARASVQWNPHQSDDAWEKRVLQLQYAPGNARVLNLAYRYNLGDTEAERYENTDLSFHLPLTKNVGVVGRWLYSLLDADTVDAFAGIEFGRCCWRLRVVGRHLKTSADSAGSTSVMLQLELAGLGALGDQIDNLLEQGIYGYNSD